MPKKARLTNNSDETEISSLLSGDTIFTIPYFQRAYKWKSGKLRQFNKDILEVVDEGSLHFLGAIIVHGRQSNPSDPDPFDVIDGQQRITTLFLYLAATVKVLCSRGEIDEAVGLFLKYLAIGRDTNQISNIKLHSCKDDRAQLNHIFEDLLRLPEFKEALGSFEFRPLPSSGSWRGTLRNNYLSAVRFLNGQFKQAGIQRVREVYSAILGSMSVVQIDVNDPTNGPRIFDSLNSRQEPMTVGDLVRNEIFLRVASEDASTVESLDESYWRPFYNKFKKDGRDLFDAYFFPYGLIQKPSLKKSEVYHALRKKWKNEPDPKVIIAQLELYQDAFIDLKWGSNTQGHTESARRLIRNLWELKAPSSADPFVMSLSNALRERIVTERDGLEVLEVIESFLVRRAVVGHEPTGLHAVFKRLWSDCGGKPTRDLIAKSIRDHKTVAWPDDADFKKAIEGRSLYGSGITKYLLLEYDRSLGGDHPDQVPWIEHVLPQNPSRGWTADFSKKEQDELKDLLANLIPLSKRMNIKLSNKPFSEKRGEYRSDSMFKSSRVFGRRRRWTPSHLKKRSRDLSKWAVERWRF